MGSLLLNCTVCAVVDKATEYRFQLLGMALYGLRDFSLLGGGGRGCCVNFSQRVLEKIATCKLAAFSWVHSSLGYIP